MLIQVRLAKSLTSLTLSHNALTQVPSKHLVPPQSTSPLATPHLVPSKTKPDLFQVEQLTGLPSLSSLHLAHNNLKQLPELHTRLGQVSLDPESRMQLNLDLDVCPILRLQPSIYRTTAFATCTALPSTTTFLSKRYIRPDSLLEIYPTRFYSLIFKWSFPGATHCRNYSRGATSFALWPMSLQPPPCPA